MESMQTIVLMTALRAVRLKPRLMQVLFYGKRMAKKLLMVLIYITDARQNYHEFQQNRRIGKEKHGRAKLGCKSNLKINKRFD
jgi:hypothetical protein